MQWTNDQPIYQQVRDHVVSLIIDDVLKSGDPIPSVRQMAVEGGVNPLTVSKAYQELVDLNIVEKRRGLGMFITEGAKKELLKLEVLVALYTNKPSLKSLIRLASLVATMCVHLLVGILTLAS